MGCDTKRHKISQNRRRAWKLRNEILSDFLIATAGWARGNYARNSEINMMSDGSKYRGSVTVRNLTTSVPLSTHIPLESSQKATTWTSGDGRGGASIYYRSPAVRKGLGASFCLPWLYCYLSIVQMNSLQPVPSHSVAECQSFRFSAKILAGPPLLESPKKKN